MKKRLLSALLAVVMVVTLLPVSVFAADPTWFSKSTRGAPGVGKSVTFNATTRQLSWSYTDESDGNKTKTAGPMDYSSGVVAGNIYYATIKQAISQGKNNIILLADQDVDDVGTLTSLTVDLNKYDLSVSINETAKGGKLNTLTIKDTTPNLQMSERGKVSGSIVVLGRAFTLDMTNTNASSTLTAELNNAGGDLTPAEKKSGKTLTVKLTNAVMDSVTTRNAKGAITMNKTSAVGNVAFGSASDVSDRTGGTLTMSTDAAQCTVGTVDIYGQGTITVKGYATVGAVTLYGAKDADDGNADNKIPNWKTTMTVDGYSTVASITQVTGDQNGHSVTLTNNSKVTNGIDLSVGGTSTVKVQTGSSVGGSSKMIRGTLEITGSSSMGSFTAAMGTESTGALSVTVGSNNKPEDKSSIGALTRTGATDGGLGNLLPGLTVYGGEVGTFTKADWSIKYYGGTLGAQPYVQSLQGNLSSGYEIHEIKGSGNKYTYTTNFQDLIDKYKDDGSVTIHPVNDTGSTGTVTFKWDDGSDGKEPSTLTVITMTMPGFITLPKEVNKQTVDYWYDADATGVQSTTGIPAGTDKSVSGNTTFVVRRSASGTNLVTKLEAVDKNSSPANAPITCTLSGTTINLAGALTQVGTSGVATLKIYIDNGPAKDVDIAWNPVNGNISVQDGITATGISRVSDSQIKIFDTVYTIDGSGLGKIKNNIVNDLPTTTNGKLVVPNASTGMSGSSAALGQAMKALMEANSNVDFSGATGIHAQMNSIMNGLSQSTIDGYINTACSAKATYDNSLEPAGQKNHKADDYKSTYNTVHMIPYLEVSCSNPVGSDGNDTFTLTLTLKYKFKVSNSAGNDFIKKNYTDDWESSGQNLTVANGEYGSVVVTLAMPSAMKLTASSYAHLSGNVYQVAWNDNATDTNGTVYTSGTFTVQDGFGAFKVDNTNGNFRIANSAYGTTQDVAYYETMQDAVNAVTNGKTIEANENFNGSITVSGMARKFTIKAANGKSLNLTAVYGANTTFNTVTLGNEYTIQLNADTGAGTTATVRTVPSDYGIIRVSSTSVKAGSSFTATLTPYNGYVASNVSVVCDKGTATTSGTNGVFTITVPAGATSVTVTPIFTRSTSRASIAVSSAVGGYAVVSQSANVPSGTSVTVTLAPSSNYRSVSVTGVSDRGTVSLSRLSDNQWTFVVPAEATTIALTPVFDQDNGTLFTDVLSNTGNTRDYFDAVGWANSRGIIADVVTDKYTFKPFVNCSRAEMVTFLYRASNSPSVAGLSNPFSDVRPGDSYYNAAVWAYHNNITVGYGVEGVFAPNATVDRGQALTFLHRMEGTPTVSGGNKFTDATQSWYIDAINWGAQNGITVGTNTAGTEFSPTRTCSRIEIVTFLYRDKA